MSFGKDIIKISEDMKKEHIFFINCHHGYSVIEKINIILNEMESEKKILLIYHGERNYNEIKENYDGDYIGLEYLKDVELDSIEKRFIIVDAYGDLITLNNSEISVSNKVRNLDRDAFDAVIFMNINCITKPIIQALETIFAFTPIICIGDSETISTDHNVLNALINTKQICSDVYKMKGYNSDILHFIKKLRTGKINKLVESTERDLAITVVDSVDEFFNMDEVLKYDIVIDTTGRHRDNNTNFRYQIGYECLPNINETIVNISPFIVKTTSGVEVSVDKYNLFKVKGIDKDRGALYIRTSFRDRDIVIPVNTHYLQKITDMELPEDVMEYDRGVRIEYGYFIPPRVAVNKTFSDVLIYFSNETGKYIRLLLQTILMSCSRSFKIKTDAEHYL